MSKTANGNNIDDDDDDDPYINHKKEKRNSSGCKDGSDAAFASVTIHLEQLVENHLRDKSRAKHYLEKRHQYMEFDHRSSVKNDISNNRYTALFYPFARAVCSANCIWRKELLEAWAVALFVHEHFFRRHDHHPQGQISRICDCASGHGLLAWALLVLNELDTEKNNDQESVALTAVCVDIKIPKAAQLLSEAMTQHWPQLRGRLDYVETKLETILPAPSVLLVGVHCCGILSDKVVQLALYDAPHNCAPLALVPCCHSKDALLKGQKRVPANQVNDLLQSLNFDLPAYLDQRRIDSLLDANFAVTKTLLPSSITPKNVMILALPPITTSPQPLRSFSEKALLTTVPPLLDPNNGWPVPPMPYRQRIAVTVADTPACRSAVRALAGPEAATWRKQPSPPTMRFSLYLPLGQVELSVKEFHHAVFADFHQFEIEDLHHRISPDPNHPRHIKTFRITFFGMDKAQARACHIEACHRLPFVMEGSEARFIPR